MDQLIIHVRSDIIQKNHAQVLTHMNNLQRIWEEVKIDLSTQPWPECTHSSEDFISIQSTRLLLAEKAIQIFQWNRAQRRIEQFYTEMMDLRTCVDNEYPLDHLWNAKLFYDDLKKTINDRMMDKRTWFEFGDLIDDFNCSWDEYTYLFQDLARIYFPDFDTMKQEELNELMNECIEDLWRATESGFRPDFILPCDRIGDVIEQSLNLFKSPPASDI